MQRKIGFGVALVLAVGLLGSTFIAARALQAVVRVREHDRTVSVTGSARERVVSDLVVWRADVTTRATTLQLAYNALVEAVPHVQSYLVAHHIPADKIAVQSVRIQEQYARTSQGEEIPEQIIGYTLSQAIEVTSSDVQGVTRVSREVTELINQGVEIQSEAPSYIYTHLAELKVRLIAAAARDARTRAERVAQNNHASLGRVANARIGVVQVNAEHESDVSGEGMNDTSSIVKDALSVVSTVYYLE